MAVSKLPRVVEVSTRAPATLIVTFDDGRVNEIDLTDQLWGTMFEPLKDPGYFSQVKVNEELGTVEWPNGLDLAPETLYQPDLADAPQGVTPRSNP